MNLNIPFLAFLFNLKKDTKDIKKATSKESNTELLKEASELTSNRGTIRSAIKVDPAINRGKNLPELEKKQNENDEKIQEFLKEHKNSGDLGNFEIILMTKLK